VGATLLPMNAQASSRTLWKLGAAGFLEIVYGFGAGVSRNSAAMRFLRRSATQIGGPAAQVPATGISSTVAR